MDHLHVDYRIERCGRKGAVGAHHVVRVSVFGFCRTSGKQNEQERLYLVGLNAGRAFLEAMKAGQISEQAAKDEVPINVLQRLEGPSNDFVISKIYTAATGDAYDDIVKKKRSKWGPTQKQDARFAYTYRNCVLIK
jgi:hypothetical protein